MFQTALTDLFGMKHPMIVGGMMWLSTSEFVAACARGGAMAFMTARSHPNPEAFEQDLIRCLERANGAPFGVNFSISRHQANEMNEQCFDIALRHGITRFETAGNNPEDMIRRIREAGGVVIHKVTGLRHAIKAASCGADAISVVGMEAGGHPGMNPHPGHVLLAAIRAEIDLPVALGGAIGTGRQILSALAQGASAAVMASRFLACEEIVAHSNYKMRVINATMDDTIPILRSIKNTTRVLHNATAREIINIERQLGDEARFTDFGDLIRGDYGYRHALVGGDVETGLMAMSASVAHVSRTESASDLVARLVDEMETAWKQLTSLRR